MTIIADYGDQSILTENKQIPGLVNMYINGKVINKEYIWVPYVSPLGPKMIGATYQNWGGVNSNPWLTWDLHTQTYERLPDFWWFRNMFYWDVPQKLFVILFIVDVSGIIFFGYKLRGSFLKEK